MCLVPFNRLLQIGTSNEDNNLNDAFRYVALAHRMDNNVRARLFSFACLVLVVISPIYSRLPHVTSDNAQRLAYKVTYRRLRLKLDYPNHPYNSNTHNRKTFGVSIKINDIDDGIQWVEGVHHPAVRNFMIANGVQVCLCIPRHSLASYPE